MIQRGWRPKVVCAARARGRPGLWCVNSFTQLRAFTDRAGHGVAHALGLDGQQRAVYIDALMMTGLPEWRGARHSERMGNTPAARSPRRLTINDRFMVKGGRQRHLQEQARRLGFADLRACLRDLLEDGWSIPQLATHLGTTHAAIRRAITDHYVRQLPRRQRLARQRQRAAGLVSSPVNPLERMFSRGLDAARPRSGRCKDQAKLVALRVGHLPPAEAVFVEVRHRQAPPPDGLDRRLRAVDRRRPRCPGGTGS
jgi:hypothetical protein